jgi:hypothetical protein
MLFRNSVLQIVILIFIGSMALAADSVKGTLMIDGKVIELKAISLEYVADFEDEGKQQIMVRLADVPLTETKKSVLREQAEAGKLNLVEAIINEDKKITTLLILSKAFQEGDYYNGEIEEDPQKIIITSDSIKGTIAKKGEASPAQKWEVKAEIEAALPDKE